MRGTHLAVICLTVVSSVARAADDTEEPPPPPRAPVTAVAPQPVPEVIPDGPKSETTAFVLSATGPLMSFGLLLGGGVIAGTGNAGHVRQDIGSGIVWIGALSLPFAPSFGHFYAGHYLTAGMGLRALGIGLAIAGAANITLRIDCADLDCPPPHDNTAGGVLLLAGVVTYTAGWIYDVHTARSAARDYNREHARATIMPTALRGPTSTGYGLVIGSSF